MYGDQPAQPSKIVYSGIETLPYVAINGILTEAGTLAEIACIPLSDQFCERTPLHAAIGSHFLELYPSLRATLEGKVWLGCSTATYRDALNTLCLGHNVDPINPSVVIDLCRLWRQDDSLIGCGVYEIAEEAQLPTYRADTALGGCHLVVDIFRNRGAVVFLNAFCIPAVVPTAMYAAEDTTLMDQDVQGAVDNTLAPSQQQPESFHEQPPQEPNPAISPAHPTVINESPIYNGVQVDDDTPLVAETDLSPPMQQSPLPMEQPQPTPSQPQLSSPLDLVDAVVDAVVDDEIIEDRIEIDEQEVELPPEPEHQPDEKNLVNGRAESSEKSEEQYDVNDSPTSLLKNDDTVSSQDTGAPPTGNGIAKHSSESTPTNVSMEDDVSQTDTNPIEEDESSKRKTGWNDIIKKSNTSPNRPTKVKVRKPAAVMRPRTKGSSNGAPLYYDRKVNTKEPTQIKKHISKLIQMNSARVPPGTPQNDELPPAVVNSLRCVWISYDGHGRPLQPRGVHPVRWDTRPGKDETAFYAVPFKSKSNRTSRFVLKQVMEVRGESWHPSGSAPSRSRRGGRRGGYDRSGRNTSSNAANDSRPPPASRRQANAHS